MGEIEQYLKIFGMFGCSQDLWMNSYNFSLEGIPLELMETEEGEYRVITYLKDMFITSGGY